MASVVVDVPQEVLNRLGDRDPCVIARTAITAAAGSTNISTYAGIRLQNALDQALAEVAALKQLLTEAVSL